MTIEQLIDEENELRRLLSENLNNQKTINKIKFITQYGVDVGDTVEWIDCDKQMKGVISEIEFAGTMPRYYIATQFNSDGSLGKRTKRIWSFDMESIKKLN